MIYFDVTSCIDYIGRNPLGIVRVEMKLAEHALRAFGPDRIRFCYYDRTLGKISYLTHPDAQYVLSQIGRPVSPPVQTTPPSSPPPPPPPPVRPLKAVLKRIRNGLRTLSSGSPRALATIDILTTWCKAMRHPPVLRQAASVPPSASSATQADPSADPFVLDWTSDDVFVMVGLIWDYLPLDRIYAQKRKLGFKVVGLIYDLIPYEVPEYCQGVPPSFFRSIADLIWCADGILTISRQTASDVEEFIERYQLPRIPRMDVLYLGMDIGKLQDGYVPEPIEIDVSRLKPGRFVLQVGTIEARKNHALSLLAWRIMARKGLPELMPLVVVGAQGWGVTDALDMAGRDRYLTPKYLVRSNRVSDQTLLWLYRNCFMTIYPSWYEGWGLPVSESLVHGKFCLSGDNGALLEAGSGYTETLPPTDVMAWVRRLEELMAHPDEVEKRNARIVREYRGRTWEACATDFFGFVAKVQGGGR